MTRLLLLVYYNICEARLLIYFSQLIYQCRLINVLIHKSVHSPEDSLTEQNILSFFFGLFLVKCYQGHTPPPSAPSNQHLRNYFLFAGIVEVYHDELYG